jgi:hypothetical protein
LGFAESKKVAAGPGKSARLTVLVLAKGISAKVP